MVFDPLLQGGFRLNQTFPPVQTTRPSTQQMLVDSLEHFESWLFNNQTDGLFTHHLQETIS